MGLNTATISTKCTTPEVLTTTMGIMAVATSIAMIVIGALATQGTLTSSMCISLNVKIGSGMMVASMVGMAVISEYFLYVR